MNPLVDASDEVCRRIEFCKRSARRDCDLRIGGRRPSDVRTPDEYLFLLAARAPLNANCVVNVFLRSVELPTIQRKANQLLCEAGDVDVAYSRLVDEDAAASGLSVFPKSYCVSARECPEPDVIPLDDRTDPLAVELHALPDDGSKFGGRPFVLHGRNRDTFERARVDGWRLFLQLGWPVGADLGRDWVFANGFIWLFFRGDGEKRQWAVVWDT